ncbi:hypothetical protein GCM10010096_25960 [Alcaligenes pakistanensis]|uniref:Uncharacterized protein n=1 Tax=Alcaligenes pakistanensis TaxID=1482717 RepID=A0A8H9M686_9BURK|nr:hypothetical protein [Alcaligenes pakistanensis]GHC52623.1 hypothetical protein GCM10010096_25960 [Alcaligenes pakistanensis]
MKTEGCEARTLVALVVGVGFGVVIGIATLAAAHPAFQSKEWAAWVQALGSIGAIAAAIFIMKHQSKVQMEERRQEKKIFLETVSGLMEGIRTRLIAAENKKLVASDDETWNAFEIDLSCLEVTNMEMFESKALLDAFIKSRANLNLMVKFKFINKDAVQFSVVMRGLVEKTNEAVFEFLQESDAVKNSIEHRR